MRKLFKKSLACVLTAIICVSLCVAAVPVSAADPITYSTNDIVAKAGETVDIDFSVSNFADVKGAIIKFFLPEVVASITEVKLNGEAIAEFNPETGGGYYEVKDNAIKFLSLFGYEGELASRDTLTFNVKAVIADTAEVDTYEYPAPEFQIANETTLLDVTGKFGKFEIIPSVVEPTLDTSVTFTPMLYYEDKVGVMFYTLHSETAAYDDYAITATYQKYDADYMLYDATKTYASSEGVILQNRPRDYFYFTELAIYEVNIPVTFRIDLIRDGVVVAYNEITTSVTQLTEASLIKYAAYASSMGDTFASYLDMINYASQAQTYFGNQAPDSDLKKNDLANKGFESYQKYASTEEDVPALDTLNKKKDIKKVDSKTDMKVALQITASSSLYIREKIGSHDAANCTLTASYTDSYDRLQTITVNLKDIKPDDSGYYHVPFTKVAVYDLNKDISIVVKDGDTEITTATFCLEYDVNTYLTTYATAAPELSKLGKCALLFDRSAYKALHGKAK